MDIFKENVLRLKRPVAEGAFGHPWVRLADLNLADSVLVDGNAATLIAADGHVLGSGIFDRRNLTKRWAVVVRATASGSSAPMRIIYPG
jgi:hypothetical protein